MKKESHCLQVFAAAIRINLQLKKWIQNFYLPDSVTLECKFNYQNYRISF